MPKLRKMLGDIHSPECVNLMRLIETQSKTTLAAWAVGYAKKHYLELYEAECPGDLRLRDTIAACEAYFNGIKQQNEIKPLIRQAGQIARDRAEQPTRRPRHAPFPPPALPSKRRPTRWASSFTALPPPHTAKPASGRRPAFTMNSLR